MKNKTAKVYWTILYWALLICWVGGTVLSTCHVSGGFLTNYLADLSFPPWYYIYFRRLSKKENTPRFFKWFGQSSERVLISIFLAGIIFELKSYYHPNGFIPGGVYDIFDILAYAVGLLGCYYLDKYISNIL